MHDKYYAIRTFLLQEYLTKKERKEETENGSVALSLCCRVARPVAQLGLGLVAG